MIDFLNKIIPIIAIFGLGYFLKRIRLFSKNAADLLLKLVFNITLPALTIISILKVELRFKYIFIPLIAVLIMFTTYFLSRLIGKKMKLPGQTLGTFIISTMIINTAFVFPFILSGFGEEGFAIATIFQFGNGLIIFTFVYYLAMKYSQESKDKIDFKKFLNLPPIWALLIGIVMNLFSLPVPRAANNLLRELGNPTIPLVMLSLGIYFNFKLKRLSLILLANVIRIFTGLILALFFSELLHLKGMVRAVLIICSAAPIGYNTLVFATMEKLDKEFAASLVSSTLIIGLIYVPILTLVLGIQ